MTHKCNAKISFGYSLTIHLNTIQKVTYYYTDSKEKTKPEDEIRKFGRFNMVGEVGIGWKKQFLRN